MNHGEHCTPRSGRLGQCRQLSVKIAPNPLTQPAPLIAHEASTCGRGPMWVPTWAPSGLQKPRLIWPSVGSVSHFDLPRHSTTSTECHLQPLFVARRHGILRASSMALYSTLRCQFAGLLLMPIEQASGATWNGAPTVLWVDHSYPRTTVCQATQRAYYLRNPAFECCPGRVLRRYWSGLGGSLYTPPTRPKPHIGPAADQAIST